MVYNERLAEWIMAYLTGREGVEGEPIFGGLCFMFNGHMSGGIEKDRIMVRVQPDRYSASSKSERPRDGLYRKITQGMSDGGRTPLPLNFLRHQSIKIARFG